MFRTLGMLIIGLIAIVAIPVIWGGSGMLSLIHQFPLHLLGVMISMIFICWYLNASKLRVLLAGRSGHLTHLQSMGVIMAVEFGICATPGGAGGYLTLIAIMKQRGLRAAETTAIFAVDQMIDMVFFFVSMLLVGLYVIITSIELPSMRVLSVPLALMATALSALIYAGRHHGLMMRHIAGFLKLCRLSSSRLRSWMRRLLVFRNALRTTLKMPRRQLLKAFAYGVLHWLVRYTVLYIALYGLGHRVDWGYTFLVQMVSMAAGQVTLLPGGAGGAEFTSMFMLDPVVGHNTAAAAILIWRLVTYHFYLIAGIPAFLLLAGRPLLYTLLGMHKNRQA